MDLVDEKLERVSAWGDRRVLITGSSGFIGGTLARALRSAGAIVTLLDRRLPQATEDSSAGAIIVGDVCQGNLVLDVLERGQIDMVFHLAGQPIMDLATREPHETHVDNVWATEILANSVRRSATRPPIVFTSSAAVYGARGDGEALAEDALPGAMSTYGASKRAAEEVLRGYSETYGLTIMVCRLINTYGPGDLHVSRLVPRACNLLKRRAAYHFGDRDDGTTRLDLVYVTDVVAGLLAAGCLASAHEGMEIVNFGSGRSVSVYEVAQTMAVVAGRRDQPIFGGPPRAMPYVKRLDTTRARSLLKWVPTVSLVDGLTRTWSASTVGS